MAREIHHRSYWGNTNPEGYGEVYYDDSATNKLYRHSDYYENSWDTDKTLRDLNNKASIVLTPTAYSDGSLNTVIPPYSLSSELVTNGTFDNNLNNWNLATGGQTIVWENGKVRLTTDGTFASLQQTITTVVGQVYRARVDIDVTSGSNLALNIGGTQVFGNGQQTLEMLFTATGTATQFQLKRYSGAVSGTFDNASFIAITEADFDFSRGSSATRVNEQGLVEDVQILSGELVQNGDFEQIGAEEVTNGNFETDSDWTKETGWTISDGKANANVTGTQAIYQSGITLNKWYKVTYTISDYVSGDVRLRVGTTSTPTVRSSNGTFTEYLYATGTNQVRISPFTSGFVGSIDNVSVKEVGQNWTFYNADSNTNTRFEDNAAVLDASANQFTRFISSSSPMTIGNLYRVTYEVIETDNTTINIQYPLTYIESSLGVHTVDIVATNTNIGFSKSTVGVVKIDNVSIKEVTNDTDLPRIDFTDGTGSLLLEPQRTNLLTYSEDFSQWTATGNTSVSSNDSISPDGTLNASTVSGLTGSGSNDLRFSLSTNPANKTYTFSVYLKGEGTLRLHLSNNVDNTASSIVTLTSSWVRYELIHTFNSTSASLTALLDDSGATATEYKIWGAQLEEGGYPTSYIPTSGSTVTRSADVANNSGNADLFNDSEGVLYAEIAALADDGTNRQITISDGSSTNRIYLGLRTQSNQVIGGAVSSGVENFMNHTLSDTTVNFKLAFKYKQNDLLLFLNGTQVNFDNTANIPTGLNQLSFDNGGGTQNFYGDVKCVAVFKEALSNDLLERLTGEGYESFRILAEANNYTII